MTEEEWLACADPCQLLCNPTTRKETLINCGWVREVWEFIREHARAWIDAVERYSDGSITQEALEMFRAAAERECEELDAFAEADAYHAYAAEAARTASRVHATRAATLVTPDSGDSTWIAERVREALEADAEAIWEYSGNYIDHDDDSEGTRQQLRELEELLAYRRPEQVQARQCRLVRDVLGNPFRPVAFSPAWRTDTAVTLAQHMYDSREFGAMPILADALQDAGCDNGDILSHCRDTNQVHVRGCWVVDLVLGKE